MSLKTAAISFQLPSWHGMATTIMHFWLKTQLPTWWHSMASLLIKSIPLWLLSEDSRRLKSLNIYHQYLRNLKDFIRHEITVTTRQAVQNFRVKFQECIVHKSKHLDDMIFQTKMTITNQNRKYCSFFK